VQVATHGENTGYGVPCLIVAAKDDLDQCPQALQESTRVSVNI
jgi:Ras family protein T1